jgi:protease II
MKRGITLLQRHNSGSIVGRLDRLMVAPRSAINHLEGRRAAGLRQLLWTTGTSSRTNSASWGTGSRSTNSKSASTLSRCSLLRHGGLEDGARLRRHPRRWISQGTRTVLASNNHAASIADGKEEEEEDPYDKYRQSGSGSLSSHILAELQLETLHTRRRIDTELLQKTQQDVQNAWNRQRAPPPEPGPTGTWLYGFIEEPPSTEEYSSSSASASASPRRIYQRTWNDDRGQETAQVVLELEPHDEVLSLSLSVDESCIASLVENATTGQRQIRLRHIETDRQSTLEFVGDNGNLYHSLVGLEWGPMLEGDVHSLYFVGTDEQGRPDRVLVSTVQSNVLYVDEPQLMIHSQDPAEIVDVQRTKGCEFVSIHAMTKTSNEIYLSSGPSSLQLVLPRQDNIQYHLDVGDQGDIVMLVSDNGSEYRLVETSVGSLPMDPQTVTSLETFTNAVNREAVITDMDLFRDFLVLYETSTETGCPQITIQDRGSKETSHSVTIPLTSSNDNTPCIQVSPAGNICFGATSLRLLVETPVTPSATYELDFQSNSLLVPVVASDTAHSMPHKQERVFVSSRDGTKVPMSLFYRQDTVEEKSSTWWDWFGSGSSASTSSDAGSNTDSSSEETRPVVLIGYGAYGESVNMCYDPGLVPLLEQGYVLAFAHTRGGGELGKAWYHAGRREGKPKVIEDFEACAAYVRDRWKGKVTAKGFSAAGVMMGAAVNQRPELFDNLVLTNPFLDVYATMTNPNLFLTAHEWDEFGNPLREPKMDQLLQSYCPIINVVSNTDEYPRCLLIGTLDDDNVPFWNPTIFAKKVRDQMTKNKDKDKIFLHIEEQGGHHLGQHRLQVSSMELAFILDKE